MEKNDNLITEEFTLTLQYKMTINTDTGEVLETKLVKRSVDKANFEVVEVKSSAKKATIITGDTPEVILEENKLIFNSKAVELMNISVGDRVAIRYEQKGKNTIPLIGTDVNFGIKDGNKVTKSFSIPFRGSQNAELAKYGNTFNVVPHPTREGIFILQNPNAQELEDISDDLSYPDETDLMDIIESGEEITEIDSSFFDLNKF